MKYLIYLYTTLYINISFTQSYEDSLIETRVVRMSEMIDSSSHVLNQDELDHFQGLSFFQVDSNFRIEARFEKAIGKKFEMPTSTDRKPVYRQFGFVYFTVDNTECKLTVYQNMDLRKQKGFKDYLFIPFRDATSDNETYGGGRYLDFKIPTNQKVIVDFNTVYNPYCVYSHRYSCPIPPAENTLTVPIRAGEKIPVGYDTNH